MGTAAIPIVLILLLVFLTWQTIYSANRDLVRARAWGELSRRTLPFGALLLMTLSLFVIQSYGEGSAMFIWLLVSGTVIVLASLFSISSTERQANRAFRSGNYQKAADLYRKLVEEKPLARNHAFLGAALGAVERYQESVEESTKAIEQDPKYGLAYYNRALVLRRMGKKSRAKRDLQQALEADLPRRFRSAARRLLEGLA